MNVTGTLFGFYILLCYTRCNQERKRLGDTLIIIVKVPRGVGADTIVEDINLNEKYIHAEVKYIGWANSDCFVLKSFVRNNKILSNVIYSYVNYEDDECCWFEFEYVYGACDK